MWSLLPILILNCGCYVVVFVSELSLVSIKLKVRLLHLFHKELLWNLRDQMLHENYG